MSNEQKKQSSADELKKKLGVGGGNAGQLPGLGKAGKPQLPGLGKGGIGGLPGLPGSKPLPGLGSKPASVPPFLQPQGQQQQPLDDRDPFGGSAGSSGAPQRRHSYGPTDLIGESTDPNVKFSEKEAGRSRLPLILGIAGGALLVLFIGYLGGKALSGRVALNIAIRDALIVDYEVRKAAKLTSETQAAVNAAAAKAAKRQYDPNHIEFLTNNVKGNPIKPQIFTERNYKNFDASAVQWLTEYYREWDKLYTLIEEHRRMTRNDEDALKASREQFQKLLTTSYGVVFNRESREENKLVANLVVLSAGKGDKVKVQAATGSFADERILYNPEGEDSSFSKEPEKYVIEVSQQSKGGLLAKASQSQFQDYAGRLKGLSDIVNKMDQLQTDLLNKLAEIRSQEPVALGGIDPIEDFEEYKKNDSASAGAAEEPVE